MMNGMFLEGALALLLFGVWLAVVLYLLVLATRLVRGVERIATALESGGGAQRESTGA